MICNCQWSIYFSTDLVPIISRKDYVLYLSICDELLLHI